MFERFTELARRIIFFARDEASIFGAQFISTEHLLLGALREDPFLRDLLPAGAAAQIRKRIEELAPPTGRSVPTSVDLPLSPDARAALAYAAEECNTLRHPCIDAWHIVLGLLRMDTTPAAAAMETYGIRYASFRLTRPASFPVNAPHEMPPAAPLAQAVASLKALVDRSVQLDERRGPVRKHEARTRKQTLGHLIDWGAAHQQWFARALAESKLTTGGYPEDTWLAVQRYEECDWVDLVELWSSLNRLLAHVIAGISEDKLDTHCRIGVAEPIPLQELARRYVSHCEDVIAKLLMRS